MGTLVLKLELLKSLALLVVEDDVGGVSVGPDVGVGVRFCW